jgi:hypothetical protein
VVAGGDHNIAEQSKNYRYSTNHQVVIDADTRLVVAVGRPLPGNRNDFKAWELSGAKAALGRTTVIADGGYRGTGLVIPHRRAPGEADLPAWKEERAVGRAGGPRRRKLKARQWATLAGSPHAHHTAPRKKRSSRVR